MTLSPRTVGVLALGDMAALIEEGRDARDGLPAAGVLSGRLPTSRI
jgi:hypothetical protein